MRRLTHYDYWQDRLRPCILLDSGADLLIYGMGEKPITELVRQMEEGRSIDTIHDIPQTVFLCRDTVSDAQATDSDILLHSHEECLQNKKAQADNFRHIEEESNKIHAQRILQHVGHQVVVVNPPYPPMTTEEIDRSYDLPYTRLPHPKYKNKRIRDDQVFCEHSQRLLWRLRLLHHKCPPRQVHFMQKQGEHS